MQQTEQILPETLRCFQQSVDFLLINYKKEDLHKDLDEFIYSEMDMTLDDAGLLDKVMAQRRLHLYFFMQKLIRNMHSSKKHLKKKKKLII